MVLVRYWHLGLRKGIAKRVKKDTSRIFFLLFTFWASKHGDIELPWLGPVTLSFCKTNLRIVHINLTSSLVGSTLFEEFDTPVTLPHLYTL